MPAPVAIRKEAETPPDGSTVEWDFRGVRYVFREITVGENDNCIDAATNPDGQTINNRTMTRLMILASCIEPRGFTLGDLTSLPYRAYAHIVDLVNDLNDAEKIPDDPKPSAPDGSAEPK